MSTPITLSVCMPTYNYGRYIGTALESVLASATQPIEILVLDGGSTDDTRQVVEGLAAGHPGIRYVRRPIRQGIDSDLASTVELAAGTHCWLLSADDALLPGALREAQVAFEQGHDLVLANRVWCDERLAPLAPHAWLAGTRSDETFDLSSRGQLTAYLQRARSLGALFSFMSVIGFRRDAWRRAASSAALAGSHYAHVERLLSIALSGGRLRYVARPLVLCRGGSDSFRSAGLASRMTIDLRGYLTLSRTLFPNDGETQTVFRDVVKREHPWRRWVRARAETGQAARWRDVDALLRLYGYSAWMRHSVRIAGGLAALFVRLSARNSGAIQLRD